jgi:DNA invertase Pin-like site-specific DNA recombinase
MSEINVAQAPVSEGCAMVSGMGDLLGYARVFAALAEFERALIRERTAAGWPPPGPGAATAADPRS